MMSNVEDTPLAPVKTLSFLSKDVRDAYNRQDGAALKAFSNSVEADHDRITRTMYATQLSPWNQTTVEGKVVHFYGDEKAYAWSTIVSAEGEEPQHDLVGAASAADHDPKTAPKMTVEVGLYSAQGGQASSFLVELPRIASDTAIGLAVGTLVFKGIGKLISSLTPVVNRLADNMKTLVEAEKALQAATPQTVTDLQRAVNLGRRAVTDDVLNSAVELQELNALKAVFVKYPKFWAGCGALIFMSIATYLFDRYVLPHIVQDFYIKVNIVNLDSRVWLVDQWHHDNGIIAAGENFQSVPLEAPQGRLVPFSTVRADFLQAANVTYTFQNSFTVMDGLGVALRVIEAAQAQNPQTGFAIGYFCPYATSNWMTIKSGVPADLEVFYDTKANWPKDTQPLTVIDTLNVDGQKVQLKAITDALKGRDVHVYTCWVTIGSSS